MSKAAIRIGNHFWVYCEVKPGPFSNERLVRIPSTLGDWFGFAQTTSLKDDILEGETEIKVYLLDVRNNKILAQPLGESLQGSLYTELVEKVGELDTVEA